jgi:hypothetical protein
MPLVIGAGAQYTAVVKDFGDPAHHRGRYGRGTVGSMRE